MPFIHAEHKEHFCTCPHDFDTTIYNEGSIWKCPDCGARWKIARITQTCKLSDTVTQLGGVAWEKQDGGYFARLINAIFDM